MNDLITIVTAFYDIGRGNWTPKNGHPHYLERSVDTYIERFSYLCELENDIILYTSSDLADKIKSRCLSKSKGKLKIVEFDIFNEFSLMRENIRAVQLSKEYQNRINISQRKNPEYWNQDYVLVTNLKAFFANHACENFGDEINSDLVSWIDFGYCRNRSKIPFSKKWHYNFSPDKIHLFSYKDWNFNEDILRPIFNNDVYILGAKVIASRTKWKLMKNLMQQSFDELLKQNVVDDDQGLWLYSYTLSSESFHLHRIPDHQFGHDPFVLFNNFNDTI